MSVMNIDNDCIEYMLIKYFDHKTIHRLSLTCKFFYSFVKDYNVYYRKYVLKYKSKHGTYNHVNSKKLCFSISKHPNQYMIVKDLTSMSKTSTKLSLSMSNIRHIPNEIGFLRCLKMLRLNDNKLTFLPDEICELTNLEYLWLSYNKLKRLPNAIGKLEKLHSLWIHDNKLTNLPGSITTLYKLDNLYLSNNKFNMIEVKNILLGLNLLECDIRV